MRYFEASEFACPCGRCDGGAGRMSPALLERLDAAREVAGLPFVINSGYRCPDHNRAVGGVADSAHTRGYAVDIRCAGSRERFAMLRALLEVGFRRIELAPTWLHVDCDPGKPRDVAFYPASSQGGA